MEEKRKFRLVSGVHVEGRYEDRKVYRPGDVIESTEDLCQKFKSKFEEVK